MAGIFLTCSRKEDPAEFRLPAEFEPSYSTCFIWTTDYYGIIPRLISIVSSKDRVTVYTGPGETGKEGIQRVLQAYGCNFSNVEIVPLENQPDNVWIRDYGPVYLVNGRGQRKVVQFDYFWTKPEFAANLARARGLPVVQSSFNSSGGSREVNGKGTLILCEAHELDVNQPRTREEIEKEMMEKLNQKKVIWLKKGIPQDDSFLSGPLYGEIYPKGVNGHMDEFCRFADARTILISTVGEEEAEGHPILLEAKKRLEENYRILKNSTDQDGNPFRVVKVPFAPVLIHDRRKGPEGRVVASVTSYMNFIITNSLIILPSYVSENSGEKALLEKERNVEQIFQDVFPEREIVKVRADTINYYSGGFHCASINEPMVAF